MKFNIPLLMQTFFQSYFDINFKFGNISDTSAQCQEEFTTLDNKTLAQMFDASSKSIEGVFEGNLYHLGNYDECYKIEHKIDQRVSYGKYCLGTLSGEIVARIAKIADYENLLPLYHQFNNTPFGFRVGVCIPHKCSAKDAEKVIPVLKFNEDWCYSKNKETPLPSLAWATIAIFSSLTAIVVAATVFELTQNARNKKVSKYVLPFSFISNWKSLVTPISKKHPLSCLSGIKALSSAWVVMGHTYSMAPAGPVGNFIFVKELAENIANMFILNSSMNVDTFFTVGGIALVYSFLTNKSNKNMKSTVLTMYIYRYVRLTPLLAITVLTQANIKHLGDGPLWNTMDFAAKSCKKRWWPPLFYILNWIPSFSMHCVGHSWYLSVDFQLFLFATIILILLHRKPKVGLTVLGFLIFLGFLIPFAISYIYELTLYPSFDMLGYMIDNKIDPIQKVQDTYYLYYVSPYSRFGPFVIGLLGGYLIYIFIERKSEIIIHPIVVKLVWFVSIFGLLFCIFGPYKFFFFYDRLSHALLMGFGKNIWAIFITAIVFMCAVGYGGFITEFLSQPIFQFISRLGYGIYLVHVGVIVVRYMSSRRPIIVSHATMIATIFESFALSLIISIFASLTFEIPFVKLMNTLLLGDRASEKKSEAPETHKTDKTE